MYLPSALEPWAFPLSMGILTQMRTDSRSVSIAGVDLALHMFYRHYIVDPDRYDVRSSTLLSRAAVPSGIPPISMVIARN